MEKEPELEYTGEPTRQYTWDEAQEVLAPMPTHYDEEFLDPPLKLNQVLGPVFYDRTGRPHWGDETEEQLHRYE